MSDQQVVPVIFRVWREGEVFALSPHCRAITPVSIVIPTNELASIAGPIILVASMQVDRQRWPRASPDSGVGADRLPIAYSPTGPGVNAPSA